jgi:hypothetical protein
MTTGVEEAKRKFAAAEVFLVAVRDSTGNLDALYITLESYSTLVTRKPNTNYK